MTKKKKKKESVNPLQYRNDRDRSYALAGMAISLAGNEAMDQIVRMSMDEKGPMIVFANEFYWGTSQSASAKAQWQRMLRGFRITTSLAVCNVLARCMVCERGADPTDMLEYLYRGVLEEGHEMCALEDDEVQEMYSALLNRSHRIFGNPRLHPVIDALAADIERRRTLSGREVAETLHALRLF